MYGCMYVFMCVCVYVTFVHVGCVMYVCFVMYEFYVMYVCCLCMYGWMNGWRDEWLYV